MFRQHVNTPRYAKDAATKRYVDDVFSQVKPGASSSVFDYRFDGTSTAESDPGAGKFRFSSGDQIDSTTLYMDWLTQDGFDVVALFTTMTFGAEFIIQDKDLSINYQKWKILGPAVNMPDWFQVPVEYIEGTTLFTNNQLVAFVVTFVGQQGEPGEAGPPGPTGPQGATGATGPAGTNGVGVPVGGSANQVLTKIDATNYNTQWTTPVATGNYVSKTGDTMTGDLIIAPPTGPAAFTFNVSAAATALTFYKRANVYRWAMYMNSDAEDAGLGGSSWGIGSYTNAGVWNIEALQLKRNGDATFKGDIFINKARPCITLDRTTPTDGNNVYGAYNGLYRWVFVLGTNDLETGGNTGSNFAIYRYNDAGVNLGKVIDISRVSGQVAINNGVNISGPPYALSLTLTNTTGNYHKYIRMGATSEMEIVNNANTAVLWQLTDVGKQTTYGKVVGKGLYDILRIEGNTYGILHWNDDSSYYILLTNSGDPGGTYNTFRPFRITMGDGYCYFGHRSYFEADRVYMRGGALVVSGWAGYPEQSLIFMNASETKYFHCDGTNYHMASGYLYTAAGRTWGTNDGTPLWIAGGTMTGTFYPWPTWAYVGWSGSSGAGIEIKSSANNTAAMIAFHRVGAFAAYFGLDTDNQWKVGGWSYGEASYVIYHSGNFNPGAYQPAGSYAPASSRNGFDAGNINCYQIQANGSTVYFGEVNSGGILAYGYRLRAGVNGGFYGNWYNTGWPGGSLEAWIDASSWGWIATSCDYRMKKGVKNLPSTWDRVKKLRPISYSLRDWTPPANEKRQLRDIGKHFIQGDDVEKWGFIAHELQETLIETAASGTKDSHDHVQGPETQCILAAVTRALQETMERLEKVERRLDG